MIVLGSTMALTRWLLSSFWKGADLDVGHAYRRDMFEKELAHLRLYGFYRYGQGLLGAPAR